MIGVVAEEAVLSRESGGGGGGTLSQCGLDVITINLTRSYLSFACVSIIALASESSKSKNSISFL